MFVVWQWSALFGIGVSLSISCLGEAHERRPALVAVVDVGSSPAVSANGGEPLRPIPHINFLSDTEFAISAVDGNKTPLSADSNHDDRPMHLLVDWYTLKGSSLVPTRHERIDAVSMHDSMMTLPSGRSLVNADRKLSVYSAEHELLISKSVEEVCGRLGVQPEGAFYDSHGYAASEDVGLINLLWQYPIKTGFVDEHRIVHPPEPTGRAKSFYCWFRTEGLTSEGTLAEGAFPVGSVSGLTAYGGQAGFTESVTTSGSQLAPLPGGCKVPDGMIDFRRPYLLRSGNGVATTCAGELIVAGPSGQRSVRLSFSGGLPIIDTDAWKAPVLLLASGSVRIGWMGLGSTFHAKTRYEIVNYETGDIAFLPELSAEAHGQVFSGQISAIGLSSNGRYVAVLSGSRLALYATNLVGPIH